MNERSRQVIWNAVVYGRNIEELQGEVARGAVLDETFVDERNDYEELRDTPLGIAIAGAVEV